MTQLFAHIVFVVDELCLPQLANRDQHEHAFEKCVNRRQDGVHPAYKLHTKGFHVLSVNFSECKDPTELNIRVIVQAQFGNFTTPSGVSVPVVSSNTRVHFRYYTVITASIPLQDLNELSDRELGRLLWNFIRERKSKQWVHPFPFTHIVQTSITSEQMGLFFFSNGLLGGEVIFHSGGIEATVNYSGWLIDPQREALQNISKIVRDPAFADTNYAGMFESQSMLAEYPALLGKQ